MIRTLFLLFIFTSVGLLRGAPSDIGMLPQDRKPVEVEETERNPFGARAKEPKAEAVVIVESEETRIRSVIENLTVGGWTRSYGVTKALLGSYMVEAGEVLPDVIPGQSEKLKVVSVTDDEIKLGFVEKDGSVGDRKILLGIDMEPVVRYRMRGASPPAEEAAFDGVYKAHDTRLPTD